MRKIWVVYIFLALGVNAHAEGFAMLRDSTIVAQLQKLDSIQLTVNAKLGSLNNQYDSINQFYTGIEKSLQQKIDSLHQLDQPVDEWIRKIDSINAVKEEKLYVLKSKSEEIKNEVHEKLNSLNLPPGLSDKITEYITALDHVDVSLPSTAFSIPELNMPEINGLNLSAPNMPGLNLNDINMIKGLSRQMEELKDALPEMKLPAKEKIAAKVEEETLSLAKDRLEEMPGIPELPESGEEAQQQILNKIKDQALDHFSGKQEILQKSIQQVGEYKQRYADVQSLYDLPKKVPDPIKKKSFVERLVPGLTLQYQHWNEHWLDVNLYTGYRFTSKLTFGAGWNQRVAYDTHLKQWNNLSYIYGPRIFSNYNLGRGFIVHLEGEAMRTFVRYSMTDPHNGQWEWVYSMMTGLKKEYKLTKKLNGTAYLLYNVFDPNHRSAYVDRLNARFGIEYKIRKKLKKTETD